ncbi:Uncharacterised protein [Salmonella enterica subsp. enterica serovar Bovismorbificans]|uniref:Uncharacterized protein n=1 Tax=Salmonella enterica subsp. enterica serovar Bovismorbificans TaxID=58097 RepID=A0A655BKD1_SALET|nr:Uncharacterised protein [Salmonella enterica subsp. enterica serovar Bovismorbificans]
MQSDIGIVFLHGMDKRYTQYGGGTGGHSYAHMTGKARFSGGENRVVGMTQGELRLRIKGQPGVGWRYAARSALQQTDGKLVFQTGHLLT